MDAEQMADVNKIRNATPEEREAWAREARRKYPTSAPNAFRYPVISWDQAAALVDPIAMAADPDVVWHVSDAWAGHHGFWMKVVGTSMYSRSHISLPEGSLVLVDPEAKPKPGQFFVARLKGTDELIVRQLIREAGDLYMKPLNPEFPMKLMDDSWEAVGTVWDMKMPPGMFA
ncbi:LexA family protein [Pseudomonas graminis]|uniref:LexA family protein n=1 Tax=Pseudomonas graminis TaxID=158627 RepID=UPI003C2BB4CB